MATTHGTNPEDRPQGALLDDGDFLRTLVERTLQQVLDAEMTARLGAEPYERIETRTGHRNGYKPRTLHTRVGTLTLLVPQDREGTFSTALFARYQRSEKALVLALNVPRTGYGDLPRGGEHPQGPAHHRGTLWHHLLQEPGLKPGRDA